MSTSTVNGANQDTSAPDFMGTMAMSMEASNGGSIQPAAPAAIEHLASTATRNLAQGSTTKPKLKTPKSGPARYLCFNTRPQRFTVQRWQTLRHEDISVSTKHAARSWTKGRWAMQTARLD
eukprot:CAMPEP_0174347718 /NCGR_PEP_ID=MMETSP0811_2-20130205/3868_1 /TAXON_ID=73025 ORGANISM="Eutreptiella gymnastica-like, Strain CCMP1594" /NCGR_SAMPLE_ID=MMETSP0811_2 /ASSEMBLY_ACC=CAM_ASM_000667 /LENGTH=120 /DNA_ID=CAMNT_0015473509 /DNA_START=74 /DNA_END=436 /DNA_ORIENTATION=-